MPKRAKINHTRSVKSAQHDWLPIDNGLIPDIIHFSHVRGVARIFLILEMSLALVIVFGSVALGILKLSGFVF